MHPYPDAIKAQGREGEAVSRCPRCGGDVIVVRARAFCVRTYASGGCGTNWVRRRGAWRDDGTRQGEARGDYDTRESHPA